MFSHEVEDHLAGMAQVETMKKANDRSKRYGILIPDSIRLFGTGALLPDSVAPVRAGHAISAQEDQRDDDAWSHGPHESSDLADESSLSDDASAASTTWDEESQSSWDGSLDDVDVVQDRPLSSHSGAGSFVLITPEDVPGTSGTTEASADTRSEIRVRFVSRDSEERQQAVSLLSAQRDALT